MSRPPEPKITAKDALLNAMSHWQKVATTESDDLEQRSVNTFCHAIGEKVLKRLQTSLMASKFSPVWIEPILEFIECSARQLKERGGNAEDLNGILIAEVAALRLESLEFEARITALARSQK